MIKRAICLGLILVLFLQFSTAVSTELKDSYKPAETVLVKISGNILNPITKDQIEFRKALKYNVEVPIQYDIKKLGEDYYIWLITPTENNMTYTLVIRDVSTTELGQTTKITYQKNFSVEGNISEYTINPGFIFTTNDFSVSITLNSDYDKSITTDFPTSREIKLKPGLNEIEFSVKDIKFTTLKAIKIGNINFLAYIMRNNSEILKKNNSLDISPSYINSVRLSSDQDIKYPLSIENNGGNEIKNLYLKYDTDLFTISPDKKITLLPGKIQEYDIELKSKPSNGNISEIIEIKSDENNISLTYNVDIKFVKNFTKINQSIENVTDNQTIGYYCGELGGRVCASSETCLNEEIYSLDGACCLGTCQAPKGKSSSWIGYLLVAILILILVYLYVRYKKVKPNKNELEKTIEEKPPIDDLQQNKEKKIIP